MSTLNDVRAARLALINNDIQTARAKLEKATKAFDVSSQQWKALVVQDVTSPGDAADYVPFDVSMALGESFTATPENQKAVSEANQHMQKGDEIKALDVLRVNDVDVTLSAALLPVTETHDHLQYAMKALDEGKYFDANLALKAIDDGIIVQSYGINAIPQQGNAG
ncbi:YfdX family protein [Rhodalgimonas zhirmunskyi]|uniref:YfdX family protein n=1 Tax=Rhodalgimonas zhirmunskyi TaxID=2964767 RepID=UPI0029529539|nr:YfdX family protein [Rhodoalgimonas zhirmunskyi]